MNVSELKAKVLELPAAERHEFAIWVNRIETPEGDVPGEALDQLAAEIWDEDDRHAPPTHPNAVRSGLWTWVIWEKSGRCWL